MTIANSDPTDASLPTSVVIPAGSLSAPFKISMGAVNGNTKVILAALLNGKSETTTFTIRSIELFGLDLLPGDSVVGGTLASLSLELEAPALKGGKTLLITTDRPDLISVPTSITIPAGQQGRRFLHQNRCRDDADRGSDQHPVR